MVWIKDPLSPCINGVCLGNDWICHGIAADQPPDDVSHVTLSIVFVVKVVRLEVNLGFYSIVVFTSFISFRGLISYLKISITYYLVFSQLNLYTLTHQNSLCLENYYKN